MTNAIILLAGCSVAACTGDAATRSPLSRDPGPAPAYLVPEHVPSPAARNAVVDAAKHDAGRQIANAVIGCAREDWDKMRDAMVKGETPPASGATATCAQAEELRAKATKAAPKKRRWLGG